MRGAVLRAQAHPEGLAAVAYHGLLGGLRLLIDSWSLPAPTSPCVPAPAAPIAPTPAEAALVRLLANMVLHYQQETCHVL
ncbi:MAG: hypothetical protein JSR30_06880 [Proteobacteria bacterium]|nr:hypothetical protein [Pseudomonadota bacterium]HPO19533.1 hypothetical protein [Rubrivivax sp.]